MNTSMRNTAPADLMAAWRATGGAFEAPMGEAAGARGDDGLAAVVPSMSWICRSRDDGLTASPITIFVPCNGDDGLTAHQVTSRAGGCPPFADDGLFAGGSPTRPPECWGVAMIEDDGLAAAQTNYYCRDADEGLSASNVSPTYPGFCWDRR